MELLQLRYFCDAAESENFSVTARKHNVPTSSVSQTIKRLEGELSAKLFIRNSNRITLSEEGRIFYEAAKKALMILRDAKDEITEVSGKLTGEIRIALRVHRRTVTEAIEKFRRDFPGVSFVITHGRESDNYDFIITSDEAVKGGYRKCLLLKEKMRLALSEATENKGNELSDYHSERFVAMGAGTDFMRDMLDACAESGFMPNIVIQSDDPYYVRKYVEMGMGITMVPEVSWRGLFSDKVKLVDLGETYRNIYLYHKTEREMSRAAKLFISYLLETFEKES